MDRMLTVGSSGADVVELQSLLNARPPSQFPPLEPDGVFGPKTLMRVKEFQRNAGLQPDGIVGPLTWKALRAMAPDTPLLPRTGTACANCDPDNQGRAMAMGHAFAAAFANPANGMQRAAFRSSAFPSLTLPSLPSLPSLPTIKPLTFGQQVTASGVFGTSLDFSTIFISDQTGAQNRPFTVAVPATLLTPAVQLMNLGTFSPTTDLLIHELTHVWQSQHHSSATQFITNAAASQVAAAAANKLVAVSDPTVTSNKDFPLQYPFSAYAYLMSAGKKFTDFAAEQIANAVENGESTIVSHVKGVAKGAVDADNVTSLATVRIGDRRVFGTVF